jgi:ERCC4-type nuclease
MFIALLRSITEIHDTSWHKSPANAQLARCHLCRHQVLGTPKNEMRIKIDSREQKPYTFQTPYETGALKVGDYSICGLENHIAVERKEINDLIGCLTTGRERFERELHKGKALDYFALVIEATLSDLTNGRYRSKMLPKSAIQSLLAFSVRYRLPIFFAENREYGQGVTESLLLKFTREIKKKIEAMEWTRYRYNGGTGGVQWGFKHRRALTTGVKCQHFLCPLLCLLAISLPLGE